MPPTEEPTKLPTLTKEQWLDHVKKLEGALRDAASDRESYRTLLCATWALIGILLTLVGVALTARRHAGIGEYSVLVIGVAIAWRSFYLYQRRPNDA